MDQAAQRDIVQLSGEGKVGEDMVRGYFLDMLHGCAFVEGKMVPWAGYTQRDCFLVP